MERLMVPDERDRKFDKALSRHLRSVAPSSEAANSPSDAAFERGSCPDLETLAAYHERSLFPEEMNSFKEHIVGCAHCQSVLAQLEATDEIPLQAATQEELLAQGESHSRLAAQGHEAGSTVPATSRPDAAAASSKPSREILHFPGPRWKWLAPAAAIAASLLVWIALHENQPLNTLHNATEVKVATDQSSASPSPSTSTGAIQGAPAPSSKPDLTKQQYAADEIASSNLPASSGAADLRLRKFESQARVAPSRPLSGKESEARDKESAVQKDAGRGASAGARKDAARESSADAITAATQADLDAKAVPSPMRQTVEVQAEAPQIVQQQSQSAANLQQNQNVANLPQQNRNAYESSNLHGAAATGQADSAKKMKAPSATPAPAPPQAKAPASAPATSTVTGGAVSLLNAASMEAVMKSNPRLIAVAGSKVIWLVGRSGLIEFSSDGGTSWSRQTSGALADLVTGSAPSDQVCWIVGHAGTVLLTTDAGTHWKLLSAPMPDDLGGVQASDALHARVWNSLNTKSFETSDGGVTWNAIPHP
jgi:hypothetical protein